MSDDQSKASKINQHGIPWAAVVVAALGWYDARNAAEAAKAQARKKSEAAVVWSESRAQTAWSEVREQFAAQNRRIIMLEGWVAELEGFVMAGETSLSASPRERRAAAQREREKLRELRESKEVRDWALPDAPAALPGWEEVQEKSPPASPKKKD